MLVSDETLASRVKFLPGACLSHNNSSGYKYWTGQPSRISSFEPCSSYFSILALNKKLEDANYYGLRTRMIIGKSTDYESILSMADINTLERRRIEQSLMIFFKCFKENGPGYVANLFKPRVTPYNLRSNGLNVVQTSYNSRFLHGSYAYMNSHIWNQLPSAVKNAPNA